MTSQFQNKKKIILKLQVKSLSKYSRNHLCLKSEIRYCTFFFKPENNKMTMKNSIQRTTGIKLELLPLADIYLFFSLNLVTKIHFL